LIEIARHASVDSVVVGLVGISGLAPTMAAVEAGKDIALANKETLVAAGDLIMAAAKRAGATILPVDSEHSAIHQILGGRSGPGVNRIVLTASGGPFRTWTSQAMADATVADALDHPTWRMGRKITIDCATLMNKGLEIIEAYHLFGISEDKISVVIHPQSVVHGMVEHGDGSLTALIASNDMRLAIAASLWWPKRPPEPVARVRLAELPALTFEEPDRDRFPALDLARSALREGGEMPAVLNAANEHAVSAFLDGRCSLPAITATVRDVLGTWAGRNRPVTDIDQVLAVDNEVRRLSLDTIGKYGASPHGSERRC
jgi:1-deoxy-D-xylulose-5-phosphate reductoisomerase